MVLVKNGCVCLVYETLKAAVSYKLVGWIELTWVFLHADCDTIFGYTDILPYNFDF